ncbi:MAG: HD domain-containing protein [Candidatus Sumerlaeia bacterium]
MTRDEALALVREFTTNENLIKHMLCVEAAMRAYARRFGEDEDAWALAGLLHDFDYERHPNEEHRPDEGHPAWGVRLLRERGVDEAVCQAILAHADYTGAPRQTLMARTLFAVDELCGFIVACALVRPDGLTGLEPRSVTKKMKDKAFARAVSRDDIRRGAEELGLDLAEHIQTCIQALQGIRTQLGL